MKFAAITLALVASLWYVETASYGTSGHGSSASTNALHGSGYNEEMNKDIITKHRDFRVHSDDDFQYRCLDRINAKRRLHENTRPLSVGYNMTKYTIERAHTILRDIDNRRDITPGRYSFGESFFWYYDPNRYRTFDDAVSTWYSESRNYNYNRPGFSAKTGGFTQLVWKGSREVSCAKIDYETREHYKTLVVCNFYPAGNVNGEFPYNVMPVKKSRPDYDEPYPDRPNRPNRPERPERPERPPQRPERPDYDPRPPQRPDYDPRPPQRPSKPRPPYDGDYQPDRPSRPDNGYPTHPIAITGAQETVPVIIRPVAAVPSVPEAAKPAEPAPVQYAPAVVPSKAETVDQVYEPVEAILVLPQYSAGTSIPSSQPQPNPAPVPNLS